MKDIAAHFNNIDRLSSHWRELMGDRFVEVSYEDLVANPSREFSSLLRACNLDFDDNIFRFNENDRAVTTSSTVQVRRPLYSSSISASGPVVHRMHEFFDFYKGH